jgi:bifunctional DNA-binding transcriptional regulator/antitoxin component of YhaV-PrlF toxin-antitoxin module
MRKMVYTTVTVVNRRWQNKNGETRTSKQYTITIPSSIASAFDWTAGTKLAISIEGKGILRLKELKDKQEVL